MNDFFVMSYIKKNFLGKIKQIPGKEKHFTQIYSKVENVTKIFTINFMLQKILFLNL